MESGLLFLILLGIFALVVPPILAVYALVKQSRLRADFEALSEQSRKQASEHQRQISEIARLTARVYKLETAAAPEHAAAPPSSETGPSPAAPSANEATRPVTVAYEERRSTTHVTFPPSSEEKKSAHLPLKKRSSRCHPPRHLKPRHHPNQQNSLPRLHRAFPRKSRSLP